MNSCIIIQSRMGSSRLPGKSLATIGGKTMLDILLKGLKEFFEKKQIIVVTSEEPENKKIEEVCKKNDVYCFAGNEENVASRYKYVLEQKEFDYFFRICGDSPFFLPSLVQQAFEIIKEDKTLEIVSTMPNQAHPQGQNIELYKTQTFLNAYPKFSEPKHFEHVSPYLYEHLDEFSSHLIPPFIDDFEYSSAKFSVDKKEDLEAMRKLHTAMDKPHYLYSLTDLYNLYIKTS